MTKESETLEQRTVTRCCEELARAKLYFLILKAMIETRTSHVIGFIVLSKLAIEDMMVAHAIKVLDDRRQNVNFWHLFNSYKDDCEAFCAEQEIDVDEIRGLVKPLQLVRDKTHFHLDKAGVRDPRAVWDSANIHGPTLQRVIENSFRILDFLHHKLHGHGSPDYGYSAGDVKPIVEFAAALKRDDLS